MGRAEAAVKWMVFITALAFGAKALLSVSPGLGVLLLIAGYFGLGWVQRNWYITPPERAIPSLVGSLLGLAVVGGIAFLAFAGGLVIYGVVQNISPLWTALVPSHLIGAISTLALAGVFALLLEIGRATSSILRARRLLPVPSMIRLLLIVSAASLAVVSLTRSPDARTALAVVLGFAAAGAVWIGAQAWGWVRHHHRRRIRRYAPSSPQWPLGASPSPPAAPTAIQQAAPPAAQEAPQRAPSGTPASATSGLDMSPVLPGVPRRRIILDGPLTTPTRPPR